LTSLTRAHETPGFFPTLKNITVMDNEDKHKNDVRYNTPVFTYYDMIKFCKHYAQMQTTQRVKNINGTIIKKTLSEILDEWTPARTKINLMN